MNQPTCSICGRAIVQTNPVYGKSHKPPVKMYVYHTGYGCDTGCCGHERVAVDEDGKEVDNVFEFDHPYYKGEATNEKRREFILSVLDEWPRLYPNAVIDWEKCEICDD